VLHAVRVGQAEPSERIECRAFLGRDVCRTDEGCGIPYLDVGGRHVQVPAEDEELVGAGGLVEPAAEPLEPPKDVLDPSGTLVRSWSGAWPGASVTWHGSTLSSGFVRPATTYKAVATVRDEYGNTAELSSDLVVAALAQQPAAPAVALTPGQASISTSFSPNGDKVNYSIAFNLGYGQASAVVSWKVGVARQGGAPQKTWIGDATDLPGSLAWDGKTDPGSLA
jgi:hypothetical protein